MLLQQVQVVLDGVKFETSWQEVEPWLAEHQRVNFMSDLSITAEQWLALSFGRDGDLGVQHSLEVCHYVSVAEFQTDGSEFLHVLVDATEEVVVLGKCGHLVLERKLWVSDQVKNFVLLLSRYSERVSHVSHQTLLEVREPLARAVKAH